MEDKKASCSTTFLHGPHSTSTFLQHLSGLTRWWKPCGCPCVVPPWVFCSVASPTLQVRRCSVQTVALLSLHLDDDVFVKARRSRSGRCPLVVAAVRVGPDCRGLGTCGGCPELIRCLGPPFSWVVRAGSSCHLGEASFVLLCLLLVAAK